MKTTVNICLYILISMICFPGNSQAIPNWTIMVYLDADNNLEPDGIEDFQEIATTGSDENINYVVQMDRIDGFSNSHGDWTDCKRFHVQKNMIPTAQNAVESLGEVNMGDYNTLKNFIQWAVTNYPAQQYALVLWDHGDGWQRKRGKIDPVKTICWDDTSGYDAGISMLDLKNVLESLPTKPALVGFDACLMGMIENAYMLKLAGISVMVGSEETEPSPGWPYDTISQGLASNPQWQAKQLGEWIVEKYYQSYDMEETQSAIDLTLLDPLIESLSTLATSMRTSWQDNMDAIQNAAQSLRMRIDNAVIASKNGEIFREAGGLSIYFPIGYISSDYNQTDLAKNTSWNEFLNDFQDSMSSSWIEMARKQVLSFDDSDFIDLYHFCKCLKEYDPDDFRSHYTAYEIEYSFEDIQPSGTQEFIDDESTIKIETPDFLFPYHDNTYQSFNLSDNGVIYFNRIDYDWDWASNSSIPTSGAFNDIFIAPLWDDYNGASIFWKINNTADKKLIIQWQDISHYEYEDTSTITFQAILYENGQIDFQYKDTDFDNHYIDFGNSATVGVQGTPLSGLQYAFDEPVIHSSFGLSFVPEEDTGCHYSLASYQQNIASEGEIRTISLDTEETCEWQASSEVNWIHIFSEKSGTGPVMIRYQVSENQTMASRSGQLNIANRILTINQDSNCVYEVFPLKQTISASGGIKQLTITASLSVCPWDIESLVPWIVPLEPFRAGSGVVSYSVEKNPLMNKRTGEMDINGTLVEIVQDASDESEIVLLENNSSLKNLSLLLGEKRYYKIEIPPDHYSFQITTYGGTGDCDIYAAHDKVPTDDIYDYSSTDYANEEEIFISEPAEGVWYIMLFAYERFQNVSLHVTYQSFQCEYDVSETNFSFEAQASSGSFQVMTNDLCTWHIDNSNSWIEITNVEDSYQGDATITFNVLENTSLVERMGSIKIAGQWIVIFQQGNENVPIVTLENGIPHTELSGTELSQYFFKIIVPENQEELKVKTWGGTGDCDIYLQFNKIPDKDASEYDSVSYANDEKITIQSPQPGEYYVLVYGYSEYEGVSIQADYRMAHCEYSFSQYEINVGSSETEGQIEVTTLDECAYKAISLDNWIEIISEPSNIGSGTVRFNVSANHSNMERTGTIEVADTLIFINQRSPIDVVQMVNNTPLTGLSIFEDEELYFVIDVPANQQNLMIDSWNGSGDVDLYAHYGRIPDDIIPDYTCYAWGNDENIYIKNPEEGKWYILMVGYEESENVSLKAAYSTLNCDYQVKPMQKTMDASGSTEYLNIVVNDGCSWTAIKHGTWIEIDESTRRGSGNGSVRYTVPANELINIRTNNLRIADQWIAIMQSGTEQVSPIVMEPNEPVTISGVEDALLYYQISVPEETNLSFFTSGGTGDCDLYIRYEIFPTFRVYDYRPYLFGNDENVRIDNANAGTWYVMIHGETEFDNVQLRIVYNNDNEPLADLIHTLRILSGFAFDGIDLNYNGRVDIGDALMNFDTLLLNQEEAH